jgi:hypothetical protein
MYKNFNLTESEKESILKQHKSYGYGKPLKEQYNDGEEINEPDMESEPALEDESMTPPLKMDSNVFIECQEFTIFFVSESGGEAYVKLRMSGVDVIDAKVTNNETGVDDREIMRMVGQKIKEGVFSNFPESVTWNMDNDTCSTNQ